MQRIYPLIETGYTNQCIILMLTIFFLSAGNYEDAQREEVQETPLLLGGLRVRLHVQEPSSRQH